MNTKTGEIRCLWPDEEMSEDWVRIHKEQMTEKQKKTLRVSKHDSISELGRLFTGNRAERRRKAKENRKQLLRAIADKTTPHDDK